MPPRVSRHEFMTVEHLLLALLDNREASTVLRGCGANLDTLREELRTFIINTTPLLPEHSEAADTQPTLGFQRVLQRAVFHGQSSGKEEVGGASVLVAIFSESDSHAVYLLKQHDVQRLDVVSYVSHGLEADVTALLQKMRTVRLVRRQEKPMPVLCWLMRKI